MSNVALFGAAGAIGTSIAQALRAQGQPYRVVGRHRESLQATFGSDALAEIVTWNPDDPASVRAAARGIDTIIYLVGVPYHQFQLHPVVLRQTLQGAIAEGVRRMILIGTVYPFGRPQTTPVRDDHPRQPHTFKGRMRKEQEDLLLAAHNEGKIRGTVLRLPDFYGPGVKSSFLSDLFRAAAQGGQAKLVGPIDTPHEFVYVPDVGPVVAALLQHPEADGRAWNLAGAGSITQREVAEKVFAAAGRKPSLFVAGKAMLRLAGLFDPMMRELVEMHYLQTTPVLLDDSDLQKMLGPIYKTPYDEGIRQTLAAEQAKR